MNKRMRNKKAKQKRLIQFNLFMKRQKEYTRKINSYLPEIEPMTAEQAEIVRQKLKIEFDKSGKESASYVSECGWRFEFVKCKLSAQPEPLKATLQ